MYNDNLFIIYFRIKCRQKAEDSNLLDFKERIRNIENKMLEKDKHSEEMLKQLLAEANILLNEIEDKYNLENERAIDIESNRV